MIYNHKHVHIMGLMLNRTDQGAQKSWEINQFRLGIEIQIFTSVILKYLLQTGGQLV